MRIRISAFLIASFLLLSSFVYASEAAEKSSAPADSAKTEKTAARKSEAPEPVKASKNLPSDVRVLIDVSGSMKQTDPKNLRKPALDLIVRLLPDRSRAGVWTFGNAVNMLVPLRPVDANWRKQAAPKANDINSIAMFTNIGKALDEVSFDRKNLSPDYKTHIILLTDGVVDIGKDAVANNNERQRIINEVLPSLKSAGYIVHTIALSANADTELLKKLSVATDGVFTTAVSAEQLMSVFLKIFDQAVPAERVPLENNGFLVDASIKEFTALIFRKPDNDKTIIVAPDGKEFFATSPADGVNWYRTDQYDLITVDTPKPGQWKIKTEIAPQSRITVVSDLQMVVESPKNNLHSKDILALTYSFQENGKTITSKEFLDLLEVNAIVAKDGTEENFDTALTTTSPSDGFYHQSLNNFATEGNYEVHLYVDGKTFKREFKHSLSVRDSLFVLDKKNSSAADGKLTYTYTITTDEKLVDVKKAKLIATVKTGQTGADKPLNLQEPNRWEFSFTPAQYGDYAVDIHAQGETLDGTKIDEVLHADQFTYAAAEEQANEPSKEEHEEVAKDEKAKEAEAPAQEEAATDWSKIVLYTGIGLGNLLLIGAGYFIYRKFIGGKSSDELAEFEKTLSATSKPTAAKPAAKAATGKKPEKTEIDLSDDDPAHIPMNDDNSMDKLFPLDTMDDPNNDENNL